MATNTHKFRVPVEVAGSVRVSADPTQALELTTKQYVDKIRPVSQGGTGASTLTGILKGNGTSAITGGATTTDLPEGTNLYFTNTRVDSRIRSTDHDVISQWTFNTKLPTSTLLPSNATELVTKAYVDNRASGITWQPPVGSDTKAGVVPSLPASSAYATGDRVIVNVAPATLYTKLAGGSWSVGTPVSSIGANASFFDMFDDAAYTFDSLTKLMVQFSGAGQINAGNGLTKTGNTIDVVGTANRIVVFADNIDLDTVAWPSATSANKAFYSTAANTTTWGTLPISAGGTGSSGAIVQGGVVFGSSPSAMSSSAAGMPGQALLSGGTGAPTWGSLGIAAGGTGTTTAPTQYGVIIANSTSQYGSTAAGTTGQVFMATTGSAPSFQTPPTATDNQPGYMSASDHQILVASQLFESNFTLINNASTATTIAGLTFAYGTFASQEISYVIRRGAGRSRSGMIYITTDVNGDFSYSDNGTELGDCGINITVEKVGTNIEVKYTSTNIGTAAQMRMKVKKLAVPT